MTRNLETADTLVKLVLAISTIILYLTNLISGPFAFALIILSSITILLYLFRLFFNKR